MKHKKPKLLVVGSLVMDLIVSSERLPETGETVLGNGFRTATGGKGANQALQVKRLGADVSMVGCVGRDTFGTELTEALRREGVDVSHVTFTDDCASGIGSITLEARPGFALSSRIIVSPGANMTLNKENIVFLTNEIADYDMVLLQLEIPMEINEIVLRCASAAGVPVMLNPAPYAALSDEVFALASYLSPNETEAERLFGFSPRLGEDGVVKEDVERIRAFMKAHDVKKMLLTLGEHGAAYISADEAVYCRSVENACVVDPTAAGDSFIGTYCTTCCLGYSDADALFIANHTAAITVGGMGAQPSLPRLEEVLSSITKASAKIDPTLLSQLAEKDEILTSDTKRSSFDAFVESAAKETKEFLLELNYEELLSAAELIITARKNGKRIHVSGIGKPAYIAGYAASLISSTGTPAYFLHGTEAVHGSCGQLEREDVVIFISNSGETLEMKACIQAVKCNNCRVIGISGNRDSWLAKESDIHLMAHVGAEGGPLDRAPRNSILAEALVIQALSVMLQAHVGWDIKEYVKRHPGGMLGKL